MKLGIFGIKSVGKRKKGGKVRKALRERKEKEGKGKNKEKGKTSEKVAEVVKTSSNWPVSVFRIRRRV